MKKTFILLLVALALWGISASTASAQFPWSKGLVTCGNGSGSGKVDPSTGKAVTAAQDCQFPDLINMINTIIQYLIFIAMPIAAISFAYAGWIYLSAGGDTSKVKRAHTIFLDVAIGFGLVLGAWLIFNYIATTFLSPTYSGSNSYLK